MKVIIQKRKNIYRMTGKYLPSKKTILFGYLTLLTLSCVVEMATPGLYGIFVDKVLLRGNMNTFFIIVLGYLALFLVGAASAIGGRGLLNKLMNTIEYELRIAAISQVLKPERGKKPNQENSIGDMKTRVNNDISKMSEFFQEQVGKYELQIVLTIGTGIILLFLNWKLALLGIIAVPVTLALDYFIGAKEKILNDSNRLNEIQMSTWMHMVVSGWRQVRMFQLRKRQERQYVKFLHHSALYNAKWINYWVTRDLIIPTLKNDFLMEFGVYFIGGLFILKNQMTAGELLVFIVYYHIMTKSMTALSAFNAQMESDMHVYERLLRWEASMREKTEESGVWVEKIDVISMRDVSFQYDMEKPKLFDNLNYHFEKGDCVGITGKSGCGKTTLMKILLGLEDLKEGGVCVNEVLLEQINLSSYYKNISGVMQGMHLFNVSIRENLLYASPKATESEMIAACKKAQIWKEIQEMPEGLDTIAGEHGSGLSGGQCQRILLARAFLKEADVYFFDEVTSALDDRNAVLIYEEMHRLSKDKIIFIVSHDKRVYKICNKMIYV